MNDLMAVGLYDYLYEKGIKVGEDISVAGYDNKEIAECIKPGLTTNEIQLKKIGQEAAKIMIKMLEEDYTPNKAKEIIKIPCRLVIRESVKNIGEAGKEGTIPSPGHQTDVETESVSAASD